MLYVRKFGWSPNFKSIGQIEDEMYNISFWYIQTAYTWGAWFGHTQLTKKTNKNTPSLVAELPVNIVIYSCTVF